MIRWICRLSMAIVVFGSLGAWSEVIHLKDGDRISGSIVKQDDRELVINVGGVEVTIPVSQVAEITGLQPTPTPTPAVSPSLPPFFQSTIDFESPLETSSLPLPAVVGDVTSATVEDLPILPVVLPSGKSYQIKGSAVRFRDGPGLDYDVVDSLIRGTLLTSVETVADWVHARTIDGLEGWLHTDYLEPMANIPVVARVDRLNLRDGPGTAYRSIQRLRQGDILMLLNEQGDWWRVQSSSAKVGWCSKEHLTRVDSLEAICPVLVEKPAGGVSLSRAASPVGIAQRVTLGTVDERFVVRGLTKVVAFHRDASTLASADLWSGSDLLRMEILPDQESLARSGFDAALVARYKGAHLFLVRGRKDADTWNYTLDGPSGETIDYALVIQNGPERGGVVFAAP